MLPSLLHVRVCVRAHTHQSRVFAQHCQLIVRNHSALAQVRASSHLNTPAAAVPSCRARLAATQLLADSHTHTHTHTYIHTSAAAIAAAPHIPPTPPQPQRQGSAKPAPARRRPRPARHLEYAEAPESVRVRSCVPAEERTDARSLNVAIVGAPNAGKSTLINALINEKVSAVSPKYNTTRDRILGVYTRGAIQICFVDTPGHVCEGAHTHTYVKSLVTAAADSVPDADVVLYVLDIARRFDEEAAAGLQKMVKLAAENDAHVFLVANKCDLLRGRHLTTAAALAALPAKRPRAAGAAALEIDLDGDDAGAAGTPRASRAERERRVLASKLDIATDAFERACFEAGIVGPQGFDVDASATGQSAGPPSVYAFFPPVYTISAALKEGVERLRTDLLKLAVPRPWEFHSQMVTDLSPLERVEEVVREKLFEQLHREVPYRVAQVNRSWRTLTDGALVIDQDIQVPSRAVAQMLKARGGAPLRIITKAAIDDLERIFRTRVHLFLNVAIKEKLQRDATAAAPTA